MGSPLICQVDKSEVSIRRDSPNWSVSFLLSNQKRGALSPGVSASFGEWGANTSPISSNQEDNQMFFRPSFPMPNSKASGMVCCAEYKAGYLGWTGNTSDACQQPQDAAAPNAAKHMLSLFLLQAWFLAQAVFKGLDFCFPRSI